MVETANELDVDVYNALADATRARTKSDPVLVVLIAADGTASGWSFPADACGPVQAGSEVSYVDFHAVILTSAASCQICWYENGVKKCKSYPCP